MFAFLLAPHNIFQENAGFKILDGDLFKYLTQL